MVMKSALHHGEERPLGKRMGMSGATTGLMRIGEMRAGMSDDPPR